MLPPDKRNPVLLAFLNALLAPLQWVDQHRIVEYGEGSSAAQWKSTTTYAKYDQVIFQNVVYQSIIDNNTASPLDSTSWMQIQSIFIGLNERLQYNGGVLTLTYALNKWLWTSFVQPPSQSEVYITAGAIVTTGFLVAQTTGSSIGLTTSSATIGSRSAFSTPINFIIHIPAAVYAATNEKAIRGFVDKYVPASLNYSIVTY